MSRARPSVAARRGRGRAGEGKRVLVFGEGDSDTSAIRELIGALCPSVGKVEVRRKPLVLIKDAPPQAVRSRAEAVAKVVAFDDAREPVACVFAHEDADAAEPAHEPIATRIEEALRGALSRAGVTGCAVHAVVPAWEMEAWWLLWPEQVAGIVRSWRIPDYAGRDVGRVTDAKEALTRALRPRTRRNGRRPRDFRETDGPDVARAVRQAGLAAEPRGRSASYQRFRDSVRDCCEH